MFSNYAIEPLMHQARQYKLKVNPRLKTQNKTSTKYKLNPNSVQTIIDMAGPGRTKRRKKQKRRGVIKKRIPRTLVPKNKLIRIKASDYVNYSCTSGALSMMPVQANSCNDPYLSLSTQQPLGFDQFAALYRKAFVVGSKISMTIYNSSSQAIIYGITPMPVVQGTTGLSSYEYYRELPGTKSRLLSPDVDHGYTSHAVSVKKHLSVKNIKDEEDLKMDLSTTSAPTRAFYWHTWVQPIDQTTTTTGIQAVVDVEYILLLTDMVIPGRS